MESRIFFEALDAWGTNLSTRAMVAWGDLSPLAHICRNPLLGLACVLEGLMSFEQKATLLQQSCKTTFLLGRPLDHFLYRWKYTSPCSYPMASWLPTPGSKGYISPFGGEGYEQQALWRSTQHWSSTILRRGYQFSGSALRAARSTTCGPPGTTPARKRRPTQSTGFGSTQVAGSRFWSRRSA